MEPTPSRKARVLAALKDSADEIQVVIGLALLTVALWPVLHITALAIPGAVITWMALPTREPFVITAFTEARPKGKS